MAAKTISSDELHLYLVRPDEIKDQKLIESYHDLMTPEEAQKQARFYFPEGRHEYLVTRALVRKTLSKYADIAPKDWLFRANEYGRPEIADANLGSKLRFNLSHTKGLIACLIHDARDAGVDVEWAGRGSDLIDIADRFFSPAEVEDLHQVPANDQSKRFFTYWTLKESYIKARGMGLSIPLEHFSFHVTKPEAPISISFSNEIQDEPEAWHFYHDWIDDEHPVSISIKTPDAKRPKLTQEIVVP